jgi:hypothetical protein
VCPAYLCVTKTFQPFTTCASGMLLSFFQSCTAEADSTKTMKSSFLPLWWTLVWESFPRGIVIVCKWRIGCVRDVSML